MNIITFYRPKLPRFHHQYHNVYVHDDESQKAIFALANQNVYEGNPFRFEGN